MMIESRLVLCAETAIFEAQTGNMSIINIIENINSVEFPTIIPRIAAINFIERSNEDPKQIRVTIEGRLDGEKVTELEMSLDFGETFVNRAVCHFIGVKLPKPGTLTMSFTYDKKPIGSYSINVKKIPSPKSKS